MGEVSCADGGELERVPSRYGFTVLPGDERVQQQPAGRNEADRS